MQSRASLDTAFGNLLDKNTTRPVRLRNAMLASGGYPWTIIHLENRTRYMEALEAASVQKDISPFASCILDEMKSAN